MKRNIYLSAIIVILGTSTKVYSQSDRWSYSHTINGKLEYYYDNSTINYKGDKLTVWVKWIFLYDDDYNSKETVTLFEFDCYHRKYTFLYQIMNFNDGSKTENDLSKMDHYKILTPGDQLEPYFNLLCK